MRRFTPDATDKVKEKLVDLGYDPKMGSKTAASNYPEHIEDAITDFYLEHPEKRTKAIMTSNGKIVIRASNKSRDGYQSNFRLKKSGLS